MKILAFIHETFINIHLTIPYLKWSVNVIYPQFFFIDYLILLDPVTNLFIKFPSIYQMRCAKNSRNKISKLAVERRIVFKISNQFLSNSIKYLASSKNIQASLSFSV